MRSLVHIALPLALAVAAALAAVASPALASDCATEIKAMVATAQTSGPVHVRSFWNTPDGSIETRADIVPPGAIHLWMTFASEPAIETIIIGDRGWLNDKGSWFEVSETTATVVAGDFAATAHLADLSRLADPECRGPVPLHGREVLYYRFNLPLDPGSSVNRVYVDRETRRLTRVETDMTLAGTTIFMSSNYTYDAAIAVTPPM